MEWLLWGRSSAWSPPSLSSSNASLEHRSQGDCLKGWVQSAPPALQHGWGAGRPSSSALGPAHCTSAAAWGPAGAYPPQLGGLPVPWPGRAHWEKKPEQKTAEGAADPEIKLRSRHPCPYRYLHLPAWELNGLIIPTSEDGQAQDAGGWGSKRDVSVPARGGDGVSVVCREKPWAELGALHPGVFRDPAV